MRGSALPGNGSRCPSPLTFASNTPCTRVRYVAPCRLQAELSADAFGFLKDRYGCILFLCLTISCLMYVRGLSGMLHGLHWPVLGVLSLLGIGVWASKPATVLSREHWCLIGFMLFSLLSCSYAAVPMYAVGRLFSYVLVWLAMFLGAWTWLRCGRNLERGIDLLFVVICVMTLCSLFWITQESSAEVSQRATGAFAKATGAGSFAAIAMPVIIWKIRRTRGWLRSIAFGALGIQAYVLVFSGARAMTAATVIGITVLLWRQLPRVRGIILSGVAMLTCLVAVGVVGLTSLPEHLVRQENISTVAGRLPLWETGLRAFANRPIVGYGYGMARYVISLDENARAVYFNARGNNRATRVMSRRVSRDDYVQITTLHSDHVERLVENGIVGELFFLVYWLFVFVRVWHAFVSPNLPFSDAVQALGISCWVLFVDSFFHGGLFAIGNPITYLVWYVMVLLVSASILSRQDRNK